jgi:intein-encoded DNA endonuclease-like protein
MIDLLSKYFFEFNWHASGRAGSRKNRSRKKSVFRKYLFEIFITNTASWSFHMLSPTPTATIIFSVAKPHGHSG